MKNKEPIVLKNEVYLEEVPCKKCGVGVMQYCRTTFNLNGEAQNIHMCSACGYKESYKKRYPRIIDKQTGDLLKFFVSKHNF